MGCEMAWYYVWYMLVFVFLPSFIHFQGVEFKMLWFKMLGCYGFILNHPYALAKANVYNKMYLHCSLYWQYSLQWILVMLVAPQCLMNVLLCLRSGPHHKAVSLRWKQKLTFLVSLSRAQDVNQALPTKLPPSSVVQLRDAGRQS